MPYIKAFKFISDLALITMRDLMRIKEVYYSPQGGQVQLITTLGGALVDVKVKAKSGPKWCFLIMKVVKRT